MDLDNLEIKKEVELLRKRVHDLEDTVKMLAEYTAFNAQVIAQMHKPQNENDAWLSGFGQGVNKL